MIRSRIPSAVARAARALLPRRFRRRAAALGAAAITALALTFTTALAQDYPTRPVTIVVPFTPGGGTDILGRMIGQRLEPRLGKTFIIENKPGAGSITGAVHAARSPHDGYTLLMAPSPTMAVNISLYKNLPYSPGDFVPLALVGQTPFVLVVNPALPVKTIPELIAWAKENKGKVSFASVGPGVPHHLYMEMFKHMTGLEMTHVPYKGSVPALTDVVAGHVPVMFTDLGPSLGMIQGGQLRALGVSTKTRVAAIPDVPPIHEAGVPGFDAASWQMIVAPARTPRPIVDRLHAEIKQIVAQPDVKAEIARLGMLPLDNPSVEQLQAFVEAETERWAKVIRQANISIE